MIFFLHWNLNIVAKRSVIECKSTERWAGLLKTNEFSKFQLEIHIFYSDVIHEMAISCFFPSNRCNKKTVLCLPPGPQDGQFIWKRFLWWEILEFEQNLEHWFTRFHTLVWFFYKTDWVTRLRLWVLSQADTLSFYRSKLILVHPNWFGWVLSSL